MEIRQRIKENNYTRSGTDFIATGTHVFFTLDSKYKEYVGVKPHFWDKRNNIIYKWDEGIPSPIRDLIGHPKAVYGNTFVSISPTVGIPKEYRYLFNPRLKKLLDNSNEGDNPILALYTLK